MTKFAATIPSLLLVLAAMPLGAQEVTCDDIQFDERVMAAYPAARDACLEIIDHDGVKYAHFRAMVYEGPPSMLLTLKHRDETWGPATRITPQPGFTAYVDGKVIPIQDIRRGREISIYLPEGRWELAVADGNQLAIAEAEFAPLELEVTDEELPEIVPPAAEEEAPAEMAPAGAVEQEAEGPVEETAAPAEGGDTSEWYWILGLVAAFIIVWMLLRRRRAERGA